MAKQINGIQQLGVGVENVNESFKWFRQNFGMDVLIFEEKAVAELMLAHTGGQKRERHAMLAINMQGGGGFEIWQHTGKIPAKPKFEIQLGDLGISVGKLRTANIEKAYATFQKKGLKLLTKIEEAPSEIPHFFMKDAFDNLWEFVHDSWIFKKTKATNGGVLGALIGVKDIEESLKVYCDILNYDKVVYDQTGVFNDWEGLPGAVNTFRRVLLRHSEKRTGPFSPLLGPTEIELVQVLDREPVDIFKERIWGDPGFIHLCFDICGMNDIREEVKTKGFPFTVDSATQGNTFDMGEAAGGFAYIQAPEGTLIEFVETQKVPVAKKLGIQIDLAKRPDNKPLPRWLLGLFSLKRVKN